jgi:glycosyltransferase involved in cell wall biosynthesis
MLNSRVLVSIIIPTYNGVATLKRAVDSIRNQKAKWTYEILVCDDNSVDNTRELAMKLGCQVFINETHTGGPNPGKNLGLKKARGKFICFLDQDDEWLPNKIEAQLSEMEKGADLVASAAIIRMEN